MKRLLMIALVSTAVGVSFGTQYLLYKVAGHWQEKYSTLREQVDSVDHGCDVCGGRVYQFDMTDFSELCREHAGVGPYVAPDAQEPTASEEISNMQEWPISANEKTFLAEGVTNN